MNPLLIKIADAVNPSDRNTAVTGGENGAKESDDTQKPPEMDKKKPEEKKPEIVAQPADAAATGLTPEFGLALLDFFAQNGEVSDTDFHSFAEQSGMDVPMAEQAAYKLAGITARFIRGGKFANSGMTYDDLDPDQLQMGIEIEQEHTPDIEIATKIAADHLTENPSYYSYLTAMEDQAKQDMGSGEGDGVQQDGGPNQENAAEQGQVQATGTHNNSETPLQS